VKQKKYTKHIKQLQKGNPSWDFRLEYRETESISWKEVGVQMKWWIRVVCIISDKFILSFFRLFLNLLANDLHIAGNVTLFLPCEVEMMVGGWVHSSFDVTRLSIPLRVFLEQKMLLNSLNLHIIYYFLGWWRSWWWWWWWLYSERVWQNAIDISFLSGDTLLSSYFFFFRARDVFGLL